MTLALVVYAPALKNGFVWDDQALVLRDPLIRSWRSAWEGFQHFLFTDATASDFYRPVQRLTYTIDYAAFAFSPAGYHLVSILWHGAAAAALFLCGQELLGFLGLQKSRARAIAFISALLWMVHPVQSAAVTYISGRADPLSATFGFLGLYSILRGLGHDGGKRWLFDIAAGVCFLAGALSKECGLVFLALSLIVLCVRSVRRDWLRFLVIATCVIITYLSLRLPAEHLAPPAARDPIPLVVRPIIALRALAEYAGLVILPVNLHLDRDVVTHPFGFSSASLAAASLRELQTLAGLLIFMGGTYLLWRSRKQTRFFLPLLLALISYLPVSGVIPLNATVAEHWLYLPTAFLFLGLFVGLDSLGWSVDKSGLARVVSATIVIWLVLLPIRTFTSTFDWKDQRTFLTRTIEHGGDSARMWINLGSLESGEGHLEAAQVAFARALQKEPDNPMALLGSGGVAIKQHDFARARELLTRVSDPPALQALAQERLALLENQETGKIDLMRLRLAARIGPANWSIEKRYIQTLAGSGYPDRAIHELKTCLVSAPYRAESWVMMSDLMRQIGRPNEAAVAFSEAQERDVHLSRTL